MKKKTLMKQSSFGPCLVEKYYSHLVFQCKYTSWQLHNIGVTWSFGWFELRRWWEAAFSLSETAVKYAARIRSSLSRAISLKLTHQFFSSNCKGAIITSRHLTIFSDRVWTCPRAKRRRRISDRIRRNLLKTPMTLINSEDFCLE